MVDVRVTAHDVIQALKTATPKQRNYIAWMFRTMDRDSDSDSVNYEFDHGCEIYPGGETERKVNVPFGVYRDRDEKE